MQFDVSMVAPVAREAFERMHVDTLNFAVLFGILIATGVGYDVVATWYSDLALAYQIGFLFANLIIQAWATLSILDGAGIAPVRPWKLRIGSMFGVGLLSGLGIGLGLVLLILPGVYLAGRWFLAVPILLAEDMSVSDALSQSWERTENTWLSCSTIVVVSFAWQLAPIAGGLFVETPNVAAQWGWMLLSNTFSQAGWLFGVVAAATFYIALGRRQSGAAEIFG